MYNTRYTRKKIEETLDILTKNHPPIRTASWIIDQRWADGVSDSTDIVSNPFAIVDGKRITLKPAKIANENENVLAYIRKHTHAYVAKKRISGNNVVLHLMQLDDTDRTKFNTGNDASTYIKNNDVFIKIDFDVYYKTEYAIPDGETEIDRNYIKLTITTDKQTDIGWNKWDKNKLIGVYEGNVDVENNTTNTTKYLFSRSNKRPTFNSYNEFKTAAANKGNGYYICDYDTLRFFRLLFYAWHENIYAQNVCGSGTKNSVKNENNISVYYPKITGNTNHLAMTDTTVNTGSGAADSTIDENQIKAGEGTDIVSTNFWGLENFYGDISEYIYDVQIAKYDPNNPSGYVPAIINGRDGIYVTDPITGVTTFCTSVSDFITMFPASCNFILIHPIGVNSHFRLITVRQIPQGYGTLMHMIFGNNADILPKSIHYPKSTSLEYCVDTNDVRTINTWPNTFASSGYSNTEGINYFAGIENRDLSNSVTGARLMFIGSDETIIIDNN